MTKREKILRQRIVYLMKIRAGFTSKKNAAEWLRTDKEITALQLRIDHIRGRS